MGMGSMEVTVAATEREVHEAAVALWPFVQSGQVGFPLAGKKSREGLETVWSSHPEREGDELYIVRCGPVIMGGVWLLSVRCEERSDGVRPCRCQQSRGGVCAAPRQHAGATPTRLDHCGDFPPSCSSACLVEKCGRVAGTLSPV